MGTQKGRRHVECSPPDAFVTRESDDGGTYEGFPGRGTFDRTLDELEAIGIAHGWDRRGESANTLPTRVEAGLTDEPDDDEERAVRAMIDVLRSTR
ncbi:hypothetical protein [Halalkalicoccus salilacus]|uniref:hypothetical protein n=1 Tax=Halalkalicoccus sp. GCM10025704 TaxID=3252662 RepID=UPI00361B5F6E